MPLGPAVVIALPLGVWAVLMVLGAVIWLIEQPRRLRERKRKREAKIQLANDLRDAQAPPRLPYGYSNAPTDPDADRLR